MILLPDIQSAHDAEQVAAKLAAALVEPLLIDRRVLQITISIGVATFPDDAENEQTLMEFADEAMYRAKRSGKNRIEANNQRKPSSV